MQRSGDEWARILDSCLELPWPVVAQRVVPTARIDIAYTSADGTIDLDAPGRDAAAQLYAA